jgi:hypothetical protein
VTGGGDGVNAINSLVAFYDVQSTARQTIQNCQISPVDSQPYLIYHRAQI